MKATAMDEAAYFEQFSGHKLTDDSWWDTWAIVYSGFIHREYRSEQEAVDELNRLQNENPIYKCRIVHTEKAGYGDMHLKQLSYPIFPIGGFK